MQTHEFSAVGQKHIHLIECDKNEKILFEIRKHPIGLLGIYIFGILSAVALFAASLGLAYMLDGDKAGLGADLGSLRPAVVLVGAVLSLLALGVTAASAYIYKSNVVFVTTEKIAQVLYRTIFDRKVSQLSIGDVQDVTTSQRGLVARFFNYGTLVIETAGEQSNYTFTFTPHPYEASKAIVNAHEENLKLYGN